MATQQQKKHKIKIQSYADDNTILIRHPSQYKAILQTYKRHGDASEDSVNEQKTQIFRLGIPHQAETADFKDMIKEKVTILGAIFCQNREEETQKNLVKPTAKIQ